MYRKSYSFNDMPDRFGETVKSTKDKNYEVHNSPQKKVNCSGNGKIFGQFEIDDIIIILVAALLISEDCNDKLLFLALGFVFISGIA